MSRPASGPRPRLDLTAATLNELLNNTLDPGYRAAKARNRPRRWWDGPAVWVGCLLIGLIFVIAYQQSHLAAPARDAARHDLISRIKAEQSTASGLESQAKKLSSQVGQLRDAQLPGDTSSVKAAEVAAGSVAVSGPGMQVELADPSTPPTQGNGRPGTTPQSEVAVLRDTDLRAVVNQLWAAGAEAIAINGQRLTPTSFIRVAGENILVDFQPLSSPYTISAIGDSNDLQVGFAQSAIARRLKTLVAVDGITFRFGGKSKLELPSVTVGQPHYAQLGPQPILSSPAGTDGPSGPSSSTGTTGTPNPTATESR
ncbi:MAG TPA: DUF881 domain-containing protein [Jatrophihabitans sp.]|nr:DUF881 domain-containing protein [Jatrophihabitans sp.]